jgi:hypothetical protein
MKKYTLIVLVILRGCSLVAQSEPQTNTDKNQAISFSYSPFTFTRFFVGVEKNMSDGYKVIPGEYGVKAVVYAPEGAIGSFTIAYGRSLTERVSFGLGLTYEQFHRKWDLYVDANSPHYFKERFHVFQVIPQIRIDYVKRKNVALFCSAGLGWGYSFNTRGRFGDIIEPKNKSIGGFQIWLLGFEVNPTDNLLIRFNTIGFGTIGFGEFGLGYRF